MIARRPSCAGIVIVLLVLVVVAWMRLPAGHPTELRQRSQCVTNLSAIGTGIIVYRTDHYGCSPPDLYSLVATGGWDAGLFVCPAMTTPDPQVPYRPPADPLVERVKLMDASDYIYVRGLGDYAQTPGGMVMVFELPANHGQNMVNMLYADAHVEKSSLQKQRADLQATFNYLRQKRDLHGK